MVEIDIDTINLYRQWHTAVVHRIAQLHVKSRWLSWIRLLAFLAFAASLLFVIFNNAFLFWIPLLVLAGFIGLIIYHEKVIKETLFAETRERVLKEELNAHEYRFSFDGGAEFVNTHHPYTSDLDIFGDNSLFQSLNRTTTTSGKSKLAALFMNSLTAAHDITKTQEAVKDLSGKPNWLINFRTLGLLGKEKQGSENEIITWLDTKPLFRAFIFKVLLVLTPILSLSVLGMVISGMVPFSLLLLYSVLPFGLPGIYGRLISRRHDQLSRKTAIMASYSKRLAMIEDESFDSAQLKQLQTLIKQDKTKASKAISHLGRIISSFDARLNWLMWLVLNFLLLWDIRQVYRLEEWQHKYHEDIKNWLDTLAEFEALSSLAGFSILNPAFTFPAITSKKLVVTATNAGHPLIPSERRIDNDIAIKGTGTFDIITGANMAGKSTYLRTVAINLVLAQAGAPVCAASFTFYPSAIHTSLHTADSLSSNRSYFFAELERLKQIIDRLNAGEEIYVFLDEILKGTNSHDKQQGSKALLKQLITLGTSGMIATHDLDLGKLEQSFPANIANYSFEANIQQSELTFDYKLRSGIARNMNATFLMKQMGIIIE